MRLFGISFIAFLFSSPFCFANEIINLTCFKENPRFSINYRINNFSKTVTYKGSHLIDTKHRFKGDYTLNVVEWKLGYDGRVEEIWAIDNMRRPDYKKDYGNSLSTYYFNLNKLTYYSNRTYPDVVSSQEETGRFQGSFFKCYSDIRLLNSY